MNKTIKIIFSLIFIGLGMFLANWGYHELEHAKQSESWPRVSGNITKSELIEKKSFKKGKKKTSYRPVVEYAYKIEQQLLTNDKISFSGYRSDYAGAQATIKSYPVGKVVDVYYNPQDYKDSVLISGVTYMTYLPMGIGILFSAIGALLSVKFLAS